MNPLLLDANSMRICFNPHQEVWKRIKRDYITIHDTRKDAYRESRWPRLVWLVAHVLL